MYMKKQICSKNEEKEKQRKPLKTKERNKKQRKKENKNKEHKIINEGNQKKEENLKKPVQNNKKHIK